MAYKIYEFRLKDLVTGAAIAVAGGVATVLVAGSPVKATLYNPDAAFVALANPIAGNYGRFRFAVLDTVDTVDLAIQAPGGQFLFLSGVAAQDRSEYAIDLQTKRQLYKIPFSIADSVAATEKDTGYDLPAKCSVLDRLHGFAIKVTTLDAGQTIDVGTLSSESGGDANGLVAGSSLTTAVLVTATNGALFSTNAPAQSDAATAKSITYTLDAGTDTAAGFILMPVQLDA